MKKEDRSTIHNLIIDAEILIDKGKYRLAKKMLIKAETELDKIETV